MLSYFFFFFSTRNYFLLGKFSRRPFSLSFHHLMRRAVEASDPEKVSCWSEHRLGLQRTEYILSQTGSRISSLRNADSYYVNNLCVPKNRFKFFSFFFFSMSYFTFLIFSFFSRFISPFLVNWWWIRLVSSIASQASSAWPKAELAMTASGVTDAGGGDSSEKMSPFQISP